MEQKFCQSCGMPLTNEILGTNADGSKNEDYCIYCYKDGKFIQDCNLPTRDGEPLIGYWVGKPYWNQGICTEALELMLDHIRKTTDIKSLISSHYFDNPASGKVMEKCGFKPTGESCIDEKLTGTTKPTRVMRLEIVR